MKQFLLLLVLVGLVGCVPIEQPLKKSMIYSDEDRIDKLDIKSYGYCQIKEIRIYKQLHLLGGFVKDANAELVFKASPYGDSATVEQTKDYDIDVLKIFGTSFDYRKTVAIRNNEIAYKTYSIAGIEAIDEENVSIKKGDREFIVNFRAWGMKDSEVTQVTITSVDKGVSYNKLIKELDVFCYSTEDLNHYNEVIKKKIKKDSPQLFNDIIGLDIDRRNTYGLLIPNVGIIPIGEH